MKIKRNLKSVISFGTINSFNDDKYYLMITHHLESQDIPLKITDPLNRLYFET